METFKAIWTIVQTFLLLLAGAAALMMVVIFRQTEMLRFILIFMGGACVLIALVPMVISYVQSNWPKKQKK